jgi:hypothetical protein
MGSGSFPLYRTDENGKKLLEAAKLIGEVVDGISDDVYSGDSGGMQYDNAASDGGSLALLQLAAQLIEDEVQKEKK